MAAAQNFLFEMIRPVYFAIGFGACPWRPGIGQQFTLVMKFPTRELPRNNASLWALLR